MINCQSLEQLRAQINSWRANNESIAFVPTMGNLHAGHLSLVELAREKAQHVVVSIYVNPLQFSPDEDFSSYPRTLEDDLEKLALMDTDLVFLPATEMIYPHGERASTYVDVISLSSVIEGQFRPGFFKGVATVVLKLFNMVQPDYAVFGEKDFQQLLVIRQMVADLHLPIEILAGTTKRETDGLAMSSRNNYLDGPGRERSKLLAAALKDMCAAIKEGVSLEIAESDCINTLSSAGFLVDYVTLRETSQLKMVSKSDIVAKKELIILAAAKLGKTRLIDNLKFMIGG